MGWADYYIKCLEQKTGVVFRPRGNSMVPKIKSGQKCTVTPVWFEDEIKKGDVVLCVVNGNQYLHLVKAIRRNGDSYEFQIGNNKGKINGWTRKVYGKLVKVED